MRLAIVEASGANRFMGEILEGIALEAGRLGIECVRALDTFPEDDDLAYVIIPHEYFGIAERHLWPTQEQLARTIALTVEHPGTQWFEISTEQARRCGAILDINRDAAAELRRRGLSVGHFQIGYTEFQDRWHRSDAERDIDISYLGSTDLKRDRYLASYSPHWVDSRVMMLVPGHEPKTEGAPDFTAGDAKWSMLARSKTIINLHRDKSRSLEWVRVVEAMANGAVVFSEHSLDASPLKSQQHYVSGSAGSLGIMVANALSSDAYLDDIRQSAYDFVRTELRLDTSVARLLEVAEQLVANPVEVPPLDAIRQPDRAHRPRPGWAYLEGNVDHVAEAVGRVERRLIALTRRMSSLTAAPGFDDVPVDVRSVAYDSAQPEISVVIPMHNGGTQIIGAIESALASRQVDIEVIVMDDASDDGSPAGVAAFIRANPRRALRLVRAPRNRGLAATRNALIAEARAEFVFTLDHDNGIYHSALARLREALRADESAALAYSIIEVIEDGRPRGLISSRAWNPAAFRFGNYIDNMALYRTDALRRAGGWDASLINWEDFHLFLRLAEAGEHAVFVPQVLSWYRATAYSMSQEAAVHTRWLWNRMRAAAPTVLHD